MNPTALYQSSSASLGNTKNNIFFNIISESDMDKPGLDKRAIFGANTELYKQFPDNSDL